MSISSKTTKSSIEITKYHVTRYGEGEKVAVLHQFTARTIPGDFMELGILFCSCFVFWPRMFKAKTCIVLSVFWKKNRCTSNDKQMKAQENLTFKIYLLEL